jgi:hypothetical protein
LHPGRIADELELVQLHTVAKAIIYLNEAVDAMLITLKAVETEYEDEKGDIPTVAYKTTLRGFRYRKGAFENTRLRLRSLQQRSANVINLVSPIGLR